jgi:hypothetical protein
MRWLGLAALATTGAFLAGFSGAPATVVVEAAAWLADAGTVDLEGPVGNAVKVAFPELDTAEPEADGPAGGSEPVDGRAQ